MYIPKAFREDDRTRLHAYVRAWSFALLVSEADGDPVATHLPFLLDTARGPLGTLIAHMARANPQWQGFDGARQALAVFSGPHAYGRPRTLDEAATRDAVARLVEEHEGTREPRWRLDAQPERFVEGMLRGIVAFEIPIERLEGKLKLGQNRPPADRAGVVRALRGSPEGRAVAELILATTIPEADMLPG